MVPVVIAVAEIFHRHGSGGPPKFDGSSTGEVNALAITSDGEHFVSGGSDKIVKLWSYDEGLTHYNGTGHSGAITKIAIAPNQQFIVTVGTEGAIFIWHTPKAILEAKGQQ